MEISEIRLGKSVDGYERYHVSIEIRFPQGRVCCEWCNISYRNRKGHITCSFTGEEMVSPGDSIGFFCPIQGGCENNVTDVQNFNGRRN